MSSVTTTFAYRGDGLRDSRTTGGNTTTFTWDVAGGLPVVLDDGNQYLYGAGLTAMKQSGSWYYYLADGLGSTMAVVDASGVVQDSYTYDVYGTPSKTGSLANEFDFAGQQTDGTGLQYLRARYYDPATGTFLSREPLAVLPGWHDNQVSYAVASPVGFFDPDGRKVIESGNAPEATPSRYQPITGPDVVCPVGNCSWRKMSEIHGPAELKDDVWSKLGTDLNGPVVGALGLCYEHLGTEYRDVTYTYQSEGDPSIFLTVTVRERRGVFALGVGVGLGPVALCPDFAAWEPRWNDWEQAKVVSASHIRRDGQ